MNWKAVVRPEGSKLFKVHTFTYVYKGSNYHLEVDEFADGTCTGHGEHSTDKNTVLASVSANNIEGCLSALIKNIKM
ncbi:MAG: hypothetical protein FJ146_05010 [Deltaproteobacteria bacterium]|nr:hypothetical protein [Deltaproteobacteria bacterium]